VADAGIERHVGSPHSGRARSPSRSNGCCEPLRYSPAEGQVSIFHMVAIDRNGRPAILVQRFDGPTADTAVQAGLWASKQLGRR